MDYQKDNAYPLAPLSVPPEKNAVTLKGNGV